MAELGKKLSRQDYRNLIDSKTPQKQLLKIDPDDCSQKYNKEAFLIEHSLDTHPLFRLEELLDLCKRLPESQVKFRVGDIPYEAEFDTSFHDYRAGLSLNDVISNFEKHKAYIAIYNPERDDAYNEIIMQLLGSVGRHIEHLDSAMNWYSAYIFLSTRDSITPYHMDREMNFLLQIRGNKSARLWRRFDYGVFKPAQQDQVIADSSERKPPYEKAYADSATEFNLTPGLGIHIPYMAPHLVKTDTEISISLALTFRTLQSDIWRDAHVLNHALRKVGVNPAPIGRASFKDGVKAMATRIIRIVRTPLRLVIRLLIKLLPAPHGSR